MFCAKCRVSARNANTISRLVQSPFHPPKQAFAIGLQKSETYSLCKKILIFKTAQNSLCWNVTEIPARLMAPLALAKIIQAAHLSPLTMRGADTFTENLFTMRHLDDFVSANHPLRPIKQMVSAALLKKKPRDPVMADIAINYRR